MRIGLISDTHNLLRQEALAALQGMEHILHAGDVCEPLVLDTLREIAPVSVVRGNRDHVLPVFFGDRLSPKYEARGVRLGETLHS